MACRVCIDLVLIFQTMTIAHADLSPTVQGWVDIVLARLGESWNEEAGMIGSSQEHRTRRTMFYALGLLQRGRQEDLERARKAIRSVCKQQYLAPGKYYHGTFSRSDKEELPVGEGLVYRDYDPNWREFIGLSMILVLEQCGGTTYAATVSLSAGWRTNRRQRARPLYMTTPARTRLGRAIP